MDDENSKSRSSADTLKAQASSNSTTPKNEIIFKSCKTMKPKSQMERIFGSQKYVKQHYFTSGNKINKSNMRDPREEPNPFHCPEDLDMFSYKHLSKALETGIRKRELKMDYKHRGNFRTRQRKDILNRLYVPLEKVKCNVTVLDIDPEFYSVISGRPLKTQFSCKKYVQTMREILRTKIATGYRMDDALLVDENLLEEENMIAEITAQYNQYSTSFEKFLANDHDTSMQLLRQSEAERNVAYAKLEEYRSVAKDLSVLNSQVSDLEVKWRELKMYQKFLYMVSPIFWRKQVDLFKSTQEDGESIESTESHVDLFGGSQYKSLDANISEFLGEFEVSRQPLLYFKDPDELIKVFRFIELQNLNSLLHSEELAISLDDIKESMNTLTTQSNKQIVDLKELAANLEEEIIWEEERAKALEALARELINGQFRRLICDDSILNLLVSVEDVYEARVAPNDANLSACDMMKAIEIKYRKHLLDLDFMPCAKVQDAETACYAEQAKFMRVAEDAARKVVQIERLVRRLRTLLDPPKKSVKAKSPKRRSMLNTRKVDVVHLEQPITPEEAEYFYLFTDFCEGTDNIKEYREIRKMEMQIEEQVLEEQKAAKEKYKRTELPH